jgi:hypothetical protein
MNDFNGYKKQFIAIFYYVSCWHLSLGFHVDFSSPNIEIHLPMGFIRIGWIYLIEKPINADECDKHAFGYKQRYLNEL